jgi:uncharacterized membrane-anchored protein YitT (DUF2179 family)
MLGLNIPLFILAIKNLGRMFGVRTLIGMALLSLFSDFFTYVLKLGSVTQSTLLATLYGGFLLGTGLGFVFRGGGSTGGTDIAGRLIAKYTNLSTGQGILITDAVIIAVFSIVFKSFEPALYGFIGLFISTKTVDAILEGRDYARAVYIFSNKSDELGKMILEDFGRGVTTLYGEGMHSGEKKRVLFCVATRKQIHDMRDAIRNIDRDAFVVVTNVHEVLGKGFRKRVG